MTWRFNWASKEGVDGCAMSEILVAEIKKQQKAVRDVKRNID